MVDDPSAYPDLFPTEKKQEKERQRLFRIIEDLVQWENTTNEEVLERARGEIWQSWRRVCAENVDHPRAKELFEELLAYGVRHDDAEVRNVTYRQSDGRFCLIDFEFATILPGEPHVT